jgi:hypothetical protein
MVWHFTPRSIIIRGAMLTFPLYFARNKWGVIFPFAILNNYVEVEQTKRNHGLDLTGFYVFS